MTAATRALSRLALTDYRSHAAVRAEVGTGLIAISGPNGSGKTNLLEAVSMFAPGRGLRRARLDDMARVGGAGGFALAGRLSVGDGEPIAFGTGIEPGSARRTIRINGAAQPATALAEWLSILWLTPAMDRLFTGPAADRRRWLDRLTLALYPEHAVAATRYEAAMRERNRLIADGRTSDVWLNAVESEMATHGSVLATGRMATVRAMATVLDAQDGPFPRAHLDLAGDAFPTPGDLSSALAASRRDDVRAGRTLVGPHRGDLLVTHMDKAQPAALGSTGEQKALLLGITLAHAALVARETERRPILLLDEVAAHLDEGRRAALFDLLATLGAQVWMTGTDASLFRAISGPATYMEMVDGMPLVREG